MKLQKRSERLSRLKEFFRNNWAIIAIFIFFSVSYLTLSIGKHINFMSGYDLSIIDQAIWKYSQFKNPVTTTHVYFDAPIYTDHLELIFILISPLYWFFNTPITLIVLQVFAVIGSGIAVYLLARKYKLKKFVSTVLVVNYLAFFGIQFAIWSDVHSLVFAVGFIAWFVYFLDLQKTKLTLLFLVLSILCKEDIALLAFLIAFVYAIVKRSKLAVISVLISLAYLFFVFLVYFPIIMGGYKYAHPEGIFHDPNPTYLFNTVDKQKAILYSLGSFGFLPLASPLYLLPFIGDLAHYFILGNEIVTSAHGIFAHYRSSVALLLVIPTIITVSKLRKYNNLAVGFYLLTSTLFFQYYLHLPLSYLSKTWFWQGSPERGSINAMIRKLPSDASVATHNNIAPHITHRDEVYTLIPYERDFKTNSPCGDETCRWFRVGGNPKFLLIDIGGSWNILHYLSHREEFFEAIGNLEKNGNIQLIESLGTTRLYKIVKKI